MLRASIMYSEENKYKSSMEGSYTWRMF